MKAKALLLTLTLITSLSAQAEVICRLKVNNQTALRVESGLAGIEAFQSEEWVVVAESQKDHSQRMRFTFIRENPTKAAYVIAAFYNGRIQIQPEINGQQMSILCRQK